MDYLYLIGSFGGLLLLSYYGKTFLNTYVANQVLSQLDQIQSKEDIFFKPISKKSALVLYQEGGKTHRLCVNYDRKMGRGMLRKKVFLINKNLKEEITHKPGVPYLLSAEDMNGEKIIVEKDGKLIKEYSLSEIPMFLE